MYLVASFFFLYTACKDPGAVKKSKVISFLKLNQYFDPSYICPTCEILRPQDSRHCYICNTCVDRFDHHCQWVDTCIGIGNHTVFYIFLLTIWAYLIFVDYVCFANIDFSVTESAMKEAINAHFINNFYPKAGWYQNPLRAFFLPSYLSLSQAQVLYDVVIILVITAASFFLLPVTLLMLVQTKNFLSNQTTQNRFKPNPMLQEMTMKEYAHQAILPDNLKLFINKDAAKGFAKHVAESDPIMDFNMEDSGDEEIQSSKESHVQTENSDSTYKSPQVFDVKGSIAPMSSSLSTLRKRDLVKKQRKRSCLQNVGFVPL